MNGNEIKIARIKKGLKQSDLADLIGVAKQTVWFWENDRNKPTGKRLERLCEALGLPYDHPKNRIPVLGHIPAGIPMEAITDVLDYEDIPTTWEAC